MKIYLVMVRVYVSGSYGRYTDSYYVVKESATRRARQLKDEFEARGWSSDWRAWVVEAYLEDAKLEAPKQ